MFSKEGTYLTRKYEKSFTFIHKSRLLYNIREKHIQIKDYYCNQYSNKNPKNNNFKGNENKPDDNFTKCLKMF